MLLGATVLCFLVLLALVADRLGARLFQGGSDRVFYRCDECDLQYPRREITSPSALVCPAGHAVRLQQSGSTAGVIGIFVCLGFLAAAIGLMLSGVVPS